MTADKESRGQRSGQAGGRIKDGYSFDEMSRVRKPGPGVKCYHLASGPMDVCSFRALFDVRRSAGRRP